MGSVDHTLRRTDDKLTASTHALEYLALPAAAALLVATRHDRRRINAVTKVMESRHSTVAQAVSVIAIYLLIGSVPAFSQDFQTGKIAVCANKITSRTDACNEIGPPLSRLDRRAFRNNRVSFKFTILGQQAALGYLQSKNYLPVRVGVWRDGVRKDDDIALDIGQDDWDAHGNELSGQFSEDGQFRWRTYFHINLHGARTIRIEINNAQGNTMPKDGEPARLYLDFKN